MINTFRSSRSSRAFRAALLAVALAGAAPAWADECKSRGRLDPLYCDADGDLVADAPRDPKLWKNPGTLIFMFIARDNPAPYQRIFENFRDHLAKTTGKNVAFFATQSRTAEVEALREGRLHVASFPTGFTGFAVNLAGYVPFAAMGGKDGLQSFYFAMIVRKDSPDWVLSDLKGKKVAHATPLSNSGSVYPRVFLSKERLVPGQDYEIVYSGGHGQSLLAVGSGAAAAAFVASDTLAGACARKQVDCEDFRVIYRTRKFPPPSFGIAHDLHPDLAAKIKQAFAEYRFTPAMTILFAGADRFLPVTYRNDWAIIREITEAGGETYSRADFEKRKAEEAEAEAVRARQDAEKQKKK